MLTALLALAALADPCTAPSSTEELSADLEAAEVAFGELRIQGFLEAANRIETVTLPCVASGITPAISARVHRVLGLRAFGERDVYAVQAFAAARALEPDYRFPDDLVAPVSPIRDDYKAMSTEAGRTELAPEPVAGAVWFDGTPTRDRPAAWGTVFQRIDDGGAALDTAYLRPDDALPLYEAVRPKPSELPPSERRKTFGDAPPALVAGAIGAAAAGIGMFAAAGATHATWADPQTDPTKLDGLRTTNNGLLIGAGAAGAAAIGMGVGVGIRW